MAHVTIFLSMELSSPVATFRRADIGAVLTITNAQLERSGNSTHSSYLLSHGQALTPSLSISLSIYNLLALNASSRNSPFFGKTSRRQQTKKASISDS
jgi:hypothetical protein